MTHPEDQPPVELDAAALRILDSARREAVPTRAERERGLLRLRAATAGSTDNDAKSRLVPTPIARTRRRGFGALSIGAVMTATWQLAAAHALKLGIAITAGSAVGAWYLAEEARQVPAAQAPASVEDVSLAPSTPVVPDPSPSEGPTDTRRPNEPLVRPVESPISAESVNSEASPDLKRRSNRAERPPSQRPASEPPAPREPATLSEAPLAAEARTLSQVNVLLRQDRGGEALRLLGERRAVVLVVEWQAARAIALCGSGSTAGKAAAESFLSAHAGSPLAGRVKRACQVD